MARIVLVNEEEKKLQEYRDFLNDLAQEKPVSSDIITNEGEPHASILMATLLANTEQKLNMYCQGLRPGILCGREDNVQNEGNNERGFNGAYWNEFKKFFRTTLLSPSFGENSIRILIQEKSWLQNSPFMEVKNALTNNDTRNKIKVKLIKKESRDIIEERLGKLNGLHNYNFSTFDDKAFRLEYDPNKYKAFGSFNNPSWCSLLNQLFDSAFKKADDITHELTATR